MEKLIVGSKCNHIFFHDPGTLAELEFDLGRPVEWEMKNSAKMFSKKWRHPSGSEIERNDPHPYIQRVRLPKFAYSDLKSRNSDGFRSPNLRPQIFAESHTLPRNPESKGKFETNPSGNEAKDSSHSGGIGSNCVRG